ncbi:MAG: hydroxylamine reductase [Spirochaetes bacterium]|nr:hydroxylamine reductase [Spirochaetota bacterium]
MSMFCFQCQEAAKNYGCTVKGICGKSDTVSNLQDLVIYNLKGISDILLQGEKYNLNLIHNKKEIENFVVESLFSTITNVNFDEQYFIDKIRLALHFKKDYMDKLVKNCQDHGICIQDELSENALWFSDNIKDFHLKALDARILKNEDEDLRSLQELLIYGIKGISAYYHHASVLGYKDSGIVHFIFEGLASCVNDNLNLDQYLNLVLKCGEYGVKAMALLDKANTESFGNPEPTEVNIGTGNNPGILISGHDLKDLEELLIQTQGSDIDVYTHGEMLPAHYYPEFKKYKNFIGNYGSSWWNQTEEFEKFNGPILMTTNCLVPPKDSYKDRVYTTGTVGFPGVKHIADRAIGKQKDFSKIIEHAKNCKKPEELEKGKITGGFAHNYLSGIADKILDAVKKGAVKKFVVMAGCDGRHKTREYYTDFAEKLSKDTVVLTAGCAKFRYNKLDLGDINGIPRVLDAGQCNDSYSLAVIAVKLAEALKVNINELPIIYNIAWYEQKAVIVLLSLLYLGVNRIHLGPTLPAFLSPNVVKVLIEKFQLGSITDVENDIKNMVDS